MKKGEYGTNTVYTYVLGKMRLIETIPRMGKVVDKREWWRG
jgi:hypothetical protein